MIEKMGWPAPIAGFRRRIAWATAWYRSARTTFAVMRLARSRVAPPPGASPVPDAAFRRPDRLHRLNPAARLAVEVDGTAEVGAHPQH